MPLTDVYKVVLAQQLDDRRCSNVFWYYNTSSVGTGGACDDLLNAFETSIQPLILALQTLDVQHGQLTVYQGQAGIGNPSFVNFASTRGTQDPDSIPSNMALLINLIQNSVGSRHNGSLYILGLPEAWLVNGEFSGSAFNSAATALTNALQAEISGPSGSTYILGIVERVSGGAPLPDPAFHPVYVCQYDAAVKNQRRRTTRKLNTTS